MPPSVGRAVSAWLTSPEKTHGGDKLRPNRHAATPHLARASHEAAWSGRAGHLEWTLPICRYHLPWGANEVPKVRIAGEAVGRRGAVAVSVAAVAAALLAVHGYGNPGSLGVGASGALPTGHGSPSSSGSGGAPTASPSASASSAPSPSAAATPGPLLSSTQYAGYTYQLYPGTPSVTARQALAGFSFTASPSNGSVQFTLNSLAGGPPPVNKKAYPAGDHIYFVEANFGDDSGNSEYNFGDDGVVVTDASGHVVQ